MINEEFLQFLWKFQLFKFQNLQTEDNADVQVFSKGVHNFNSGPDFNSAEILIGNIRWYGDVEIHFKSSDWVIHKHHKDPNYNSVVLHVVFHDDVKVYKEDGGVIPTIVLKNRIPKKYLYEYSTLYQSKKTIPCSYELSNIESIFWDDYYESLLVQRLENKCVQIKRLFIDTQQDYQECFYRLFAYSLGLKINANHMLALAEACPLSLLRKHIPNRLSIEALLFGQASLIKRNHTDAYPKSLQNEYKYLKLKYKLRSEEFQNWNFFRLRPSSFPTQRISLLADFVIKSPQLYHELLRFRSIDRIKKYIEISVSEYWKSHYVFDKKSNLRKGKLGQTSLQVILINAVLPFCFFYAKENSNYNMMVSVLESFYLLKSENNRVIRFYKESGLIPRNAFQSQALIHLHQNYCIKRKCLNCRVFNQIIK